MADAKRMGKMELFAHFADKFDLKRTVVRDIFEELLVLSEKELKRAGEFSVPGMCKLVVQNRQARDGRNPATGPATLWGPVSGPAVRPFPKGAKYDGGPCGRWRVEQQRFPGVSAFQRLHNHHRL